VVVAETFRPDPAQRPISGCCTSPSLSPLRRAGTTSMPDWQIDDPYRSLFNRRRAFLCARVAFCTAMKHPAPSTRCLRETTVQQIERPGLGSMPLADISPTSRRHGAQAVTNPRRRPASRARRPRRERPCGVRNGSRILPRFRVWTGPQRGLCLCRNAAVRRPSDLSRLFPHPQHHQI